jgi:uncharacterized surface anchored protein
MIRWKLIEYSKILWNQNSFLNDLSRKRCFHRNITITTSSKQSFSWVLLLNYSRQQVKEELIVNENCLNSKLHFINYIIQLTSLRFHSKSEDICLTFCFRCRYSLKDLQKYHMFVFYNNYNLTFSFEIKYLFSIIKSIFRKKSSIFIIIILNFFLNKFDVQLMRILIFLRL